MQRRRWLKLGLGSAALLAVGGGALALLEPGVQQGRLAPGARALFAHVGRGVLDGSLPAAGAGRTAALAALVRRTDALVGGLPPHAQAELSQLLALLNAAPGRLALAGLAVDWADADNEQIQAALQSMRTSSWSLRQQAYHALHDITTGAYFSDASTWHLMGYPGPSKI